jgi:hypothetical protein
MQIYRTVPRPQKKKKERTQMRKNEEKNQLIETCRIKHKQSKKVRYNVHYKRASHTEGEREKSNHE